MLRDRPVPLLEKCALEVVLIELRRRVWSVEALVASTTGECGQVLSIRGVGLALQDVFALSCRYCVRDESHSGGYGLHQQISISFGSPSTVTKVSTPGREVAPVDAEYQVDSVSSEGPKMIQRLLVQACAWKLWK